MVRPTLVGREWWASWYTWSGTQQHRSVPQVKHQVRLLEIATRPPQSQSWFIHVNLVSWTYYIYIIIYKYIDLYRHLASAVFCRVAFENKHPPGAPTWVAWLVTLGQKLAWAVPLPSQELADLAATISRTTKVILKSFFGYSYMVTPPVWSVWSVCSPSSCRKKNAVNHRLLPA